MSNVTSSLIKFWNDDQTDIHPSRLRKDIPPMPKISRDFQVVKGGFETLCFLALQIQKSQSKAVIVRALASAVMILFEDNKNYTGATSLPVPLEGLEVITREDIPDRGVTINTNFADEEKVTIKEMDDLMDVDPDELGSYFGVLCLAAVKAVTSQNREAFNEKRFSAVQATTIGATKIFVTDSPLLADAVLQKVYASFNSFLPVRSHVMANAVNRLGTSHMGPTLAFATMFLLLVDQGMSALRIIKEALVKHRWIVDEFPEVKPEVEAAQQGLVAINKGAPHERSFLKAIYGASFVPVQYSQIANLTGLCKQVLKETTVSYANYRGGQVTESQEIKLAQLMMAKGLIRAAQPAAVTQE
jgi:hypothetical protein